MSQARYDAVADFYARSFDSADDSVSLALLGLLGRPNGLHILDVACGHGRITRELARRGANVVGIDISERMIRMAQEAEQNEPLGIRYIRADVTAPTSSGILCSRSCTLASPVGSISPVPGQQRAAITTKDAGPPEARCPRCAARSGLITGCYRPT